MNIKLIDKTINNINLKIKELEKKKNELEKSKGAKKYKIMQRINIKKIRNKTLQDKNIININNVYYYINNRSKILTIGYKSKENLTKNKNMIRFDYDTLILMKKRYKKIMI